LECDYICSKKSSWIQHINTLKHNKVKNKLNDANKKYACTLCNTTFTHQSSFSRHKKICKYAKNDKNEEIEVNKEELTDKELMIAILKQNTELIEFIKNNGS
jgi:hypothetical protein